MAEKDGIRVIAGIAMLLDNLIRNEVTASSSRAEAAARPPTAGRLFQQPPHLGVFALWLDARQSRRRGENRADIDDSFIEVGLDTAQFERDVVLTRAGEGIIIMEEVLIPRDDAGSRLSRLE